MTSCVSGNQRVKWLWRWHSVTGKSEPCQVLCPCIFCRWKYNVFKLSHDLARPPHWGKLLTVFHHSDNTCYHKHCDSKNVIMFLTCHVTSRERMFKWLYEFKRGSPSYPITALHFWYQLVKFKWRYKVFNICDLPKPHNII